jgi:hypothetical protein
MSAGELLRFDCRRLPVFFFYCPSGIDELRRGRTAYQQAFDAETSFRFWPSRRIEKESRRHVRIGKQNSWCRSIENAGAPLSQVPTFNSNLPAKARETPSPALRTRTLFARTRFVNS